MRSNGNEYDAWVAGDDVTGRQGVVVEVTERQYEMPVFSIGVAAREVGAHPQTLRMYEQKGLIEPHRTPGGTRYYSMHDIDDLRHIIELSEKGINTVGIGIIMAQEREIGRLRKKNERLAANQREQVGLSVVPRRRWLMVI